jgi:hypothetical protein
MFERYTEKARRAIFFARYEASQYGSPYIETEHLLLGLLREDHALENWFPGQAGVNRKIRAEVESHVSTGERISTSVEMPLSQDGKKVLNLAAEAAERLNHRYVEPVHLMLGILRVETSLAARILTGCGLAAQSVEERLAKGLKPTDQSKAANNGFITLDSFFSSFKSLNSAELISYFAQKAEFIDASGKRWNRDEIGKNVEAIFAPYAKKNATYEVESILVENAELFVATVLWKNALLASEQRSWAQRMSVVLSPDANDWLILLVQVTLVQPPKPSA